MNTLIIGAGALGQCLGQLLTATTQTDPVFFDTNLEKLAPANSHLTLDTLSQQADLIFFTAPARALRATLEQIQPPPQAVFTSLAKGLEPSSGLTTAEVFESVNLELCCAILSGPMLAQELAINPQTRAVLASSQDPAQSSALSALINLLEAAGLHLELSTDLKGVALAGVLKNIFALGFGAKQSLGANLNQQGAYLAEAYKELAQILLELGGQTDTLYSSAGLGDLITTCFSTTSTNHQCGVKLAQRLPIDRPSEGLLAVSLLASRVDLNRYPLASAILDASTGKLERLQAWL